VPRFAPEARQANQAVVELLRTVAQRKKATPAQIALAWLPWGCGYSTIGERFSGGR